MLFRSGRVQYYMNDNLEADIPAESLALGGGTPVYHREWTEPAYIAENKKFDINSVLDLASPDSHFQKGNILSANLAGSDSPFQRGQGDLSPFEGGKGDANDISTVAKFLIQLPNIASKKCSGSTRR